jgi:predicted ferric reductase
MSNGNGSHFDKATDCRFGPGSLAMVAQRVAGHHSKAARPTQFPWFCRTEWAVLLCVFYPLLAIAPLVILAALDPDNRHPTATGLGINCALVGFTLLSIQFVLTARLQWIEAPFGLDLLLRFHRSMALVIVALLCVHPLLIAGGESWTLLTRLHTRWYIWAGRVALILLSVQVTAAVLRGAMRLSYERWRRAHAAVALVVLAAGFVHGLMAGDDLNDAGARTVFAAVPAIALAVWIYTRAIRPRLLARRAFRVSSVRFESSRACTLTLSAPEGRPFHFSPGQFQFLRLLDSAVPAQEHPFTIASSPERTDRISLTIKDCGDFTRVIDKIRVGDMATVHGPFGRFSYDLHPDEGDLVFVAGGVGITPFMSMLRAMRDRGESRYVTLIYASRAIDDILFAAELAAMEVGQRPALKVIFVLSKPPAWWTGQTGRVDGNRLGEWCRGLDDKVFYLCCPSRMTVELIRQLRQKRVNPRRIHCDYFSL